MQNQRGIFSVVKNVRNWEELKSLLFFYVKKLHEKVQVFNLDNEMLYYFKITIYKIKKKVYNKYINGSKIQFFKNSLKTQDLIKNKQN